MCFLQACCLFHLQIGVAPTELFWPWLSNLLTWNCIHTLCNRWICHGYTMMALNFDPFHQDFLLGFTEKLFTNTHLLTALSSLNILSNTKYGKQISCTLQAMTKPRSWKTKITFSLPCRVVWITLWFGAQCSNCSYSHLDAFFLCLK